MIESDPKIEGTCRPVSHKMHRTLYISVWHSFFLYPDPISDGSCSRSNRIAFQSSILSSLQKLEGLPWVGASLTGYWEDPRSIRSPENIYFPLVWFSVLIRNKSHSWGKSSHSTYDSTFKPTYHDSEGGIERKRFPTKVKHVQLEEYQPDFWWISYYPTKSYYLYIKMLIPLKIHRDMQPHASPGQGGSDVTWTPHHLLHELMDDPAYWEQGLKWLHILEVRAGAISTLNLRRRLNFLWDPVKWTTKLR